jgi:hypothetical protein
MYTKGGVYHVALRAAAADLAIYARFIVGNVT